MIPVRVIPCLLLKGDGLVKTVRFSNPRYVGDPRNAVKIFNEKEVDELVLLDVDATRNGQAPRFRMIEEIVSEAFMPVAYGGGVRNVEDAARLLSIGIEKIIICTAAAEVPGLVEQAASHFGSQSVVVAIDVKPGAGGTREAYVRNGTGRTGLSALELALEAEKRGAGEIMLNSIDRDGTMEGYDLDLIRSVSSRVRVPVIASGGAGSIDDLGKAVREGGASAAAAGSLFVFKGKYRAVLINYPTQSILRSIFK
jgi:cyclase